MQPARLFYQQIILPFNNLKHKKPFELLNASEIINQPLWGNEYFKVGRTCLYVKPFLESGVYYIKDIISNQGTMKSNNDIFNKLINKENCFINHFI